MKYLNDPKQKFNGNICILPFLGIHIVTVNALVLYLDFECKFIEFDLLLIFGLFSQNLELKDLLPYGFAIHHAGMSRSVFHIDKYQLPTTHLMLQFELFKMFYCLFRIGSFMVCSIGHMPKKIIFGIQYWAGLY